MSIERGHSAAEAGGPAAPAPNATDAPAEQPPINPLEPFGQTGPPPSGRWTEDILGPGFEARTLEMLPDDEGEVVATLVRYRRHEPTDPALAPHLVLLYLHGRNDYFFHTELARRATSWGAAFYALDLRKHGRSLRPHQTIGYVDNLSTYDEDIQETLSLIRADHPSLPLLIMGHSTGGLVATRWAQRHPGAAAGLILNSAWLELHTLTSMRSTIQPVLGRIAARNPKWEVPAGGGSLYARSLLGGWAGSGFDLPGRLRGWQDDPAVIGWDYETVWKRPDGYPVHAQWLEAILEAHGEVERADPLECPVLSMASTSSFTGEEWSPEIFTSDAVLDVDVIVERSATLATTVTIARFPGRHDLLLSDPDVRANVYDAMSRWITAVAG